MSLAKSRHVLAIDNNDHLINLARRRLETHGVAANIIKSDLFEPSDEVIEAITAFQPKVIVGWFIGSHPDDNDKRTPANLRIDENPRFTERMLRIDWFAYLLPSICRVGTHGQPRCCATRRQRGSNQRRGGGRIQQVHA